VALEKKFSRLIVQYMVMFMGISFIIITVAVYFIRVHNMEKSYNEMLERSQKGFSEALAKQIDDSVKGFNHVLSDSMNGAGSLLDVVLSSEKINSKPHLEAKRNFLFYDNLNKRFMPDLLSNIIAVKPFLEELSTKEKQSYFFKKVSNNTFMSVFSIPIMIADKRIGTAYLLYDLSKDQQFWEAADSTHLALDRLLILDDEGRLHNLRTGEVIVLQEKDKIRLLTGASQSPVSDVFKDEIILSLTGFPHVYYTATANPLIELKRTLQAMLINLCVVILILTLVVSYFIAKIVSKPLEAMAKEANEIAHNPANRFLNEDNTEYYEFRTLSQAFNKVLTSLFTAQEELKSKAGKDLEASEERYRLTVEAAPDSITLSRFEDGRFLQVNEIFLKMTGYSREEVIGKTPFELKLFPDASTRDRIVRELGENHEVNRLEVKYKFKDGTISDSIMSARKVFYGGEECVITITSDYTEQRKAEEEKMRLEGALQRASKMEAIGTMAGGVAHDLNNILSGLVGYPELLLMDLPLDSRLRKPILTIQKSGERAAAIVQDMLTLARRGVSITDVVNLNKIILEYLKSPEHQKIMSYNPGVRLSVDLDSNLLNIVGSDVHLSKTLMNLISNAIEATPAGGDISISTENKYIDMPIKGYDDVNEGDYVVLTVSDNGTGISFEDQERIFEPFYTKKKMGRSGTGLGMAVVWGTVKDHDGYIDIQSDLGEGAVFKLYFPVTRRELLKVDSELSIEEYMGGGESVLIVDDIKEQREIASSMLTRLCYSVASVSSGEEAVEYMRKNSADILVLDMIMDPGIDGLETYKRILAVHPEQKVVVASGFSETDRVREAQRLGAGTYIKKPYLLKNIGPAVRKELDRRLKIVD
jgi:PAS domain S-box-containing protein